MLKTFLDLLRVVIFLEFIFSGRIFAFPPDSSSANNQLPPPPPPPSLSHPISDASSSSSAPSSGSATNNYAQDQQPSESYSHQGAPPYHEEEKCEALVLYKTKTVHIPYPIIKRVPVIKEIPIYVKVPIKVPYIIKVPVKEEKYVETHYADVGLSSDQSEARSKDSAEDSGLPPAPSSSGLQQLNSDSVDFDRYSSMMMEGAASFRKGALMAPNSGPNNKNPKANSKMDFRIHHSMPLPPPRIKTHTKSNLGPTRQHATFNQIPSPRAPKKTLNNSGKEFQKKPRRIPPPPPSNFHQNPRMMNPGANKPKILTNSQRGPPVAKPEIITIANLRMH